jgi:hypothetical protein
MTFLWYKKYVASTQIARRFPDGPRPTLFLQYYQYSTYQYVPLSYVTLSGSFPDFQKYALAVKGYWTYCDRATVATRSQLLQAKTDYSIHGTIRRTTTVQFFHQREGGRLECVR